MRPRLSHASQSMHAKVEAAYTPRKLILRLRGGGRPYNQVTRKVGGRRVAKGKGDRSPDANSAPSTPPGSPRLTRATTPPPHSPEHADMPQAASPSSSPQPMSASGGSVQSSPTINQHPSSPATSAYPSPRPRERSPRAQLEVQHQHASYTARSGCCRYLAKRPALSSLA